MSDQVEVPAVPTEAVKAPKAKKPKAAKGKYPSYSEMISTAITGLKEKSGSSRHAITGYIVANYPVPQEKAGAYVLKSLKSGVTEGVFKSAKESGKGAGKYKIVAVAPKKKSKKPVAKKSVVKKVAAKKSKKSSAKAAKKPTKKPVAKKSASKKSAKKWFAAIASKT